MEDMTLDDVKLYLRVDFDEDDEIIEACMDAAKHYVYAAVGEYIADNEAVVSLYNGERALMLFKSITQDFYDHRELMQSTARQRMGFVYRSIIMQLQLEYEAAVAPIEEG